MKIAVFAGTFPSITQTFIKNQIQGLIDRGQHVDIYAFRPKNIHIDKHCKNMQHLVDRTFYFYDIPSSYFTKIIEAARIVYNNRSKLKAKVFFSAFNFFKFRGAAISLRLLYSSAAIERKEYDIIHCQFGSISQNVINLKKIGAINGKVIVSFRGYDVTKFLKKNPGVYAEVFKDAHLFLPVSESLKKIIVDEGCDEKKIVIHPSGIDIHKFYYVHRKKAKNDVINLLSIGRIIEKKGFEYGIRAVNEIIRSGLNVNYKIIGDGHLKANLNQLIDDLHQNERIKLIGWKSHAEVHSYIKDSDILISPSITSSDGDQEGIPNVVKEAMATGIPVLGTYHSGMPELIKNDISGFMVNEKDIKALAERLTFLIKNPNKRIELGKNGREIVSNKYDINYLNDELVNLYKRLLEESNS
jgi:colanic acid/amylovoran biosynthesis glycosyltransferase